MSRHKFPMLPRWSPSPQAKIPPPLPFSAALALGILLLPMALNGRAGNPSVCFQLFSLTSADPPTRFLSVIWGSQLACCATCAHASVAGHGPCLPVALGTAVRRGGGGEEGTVNQWRGGDDGASARHRPPGGWAQLQHDVHSGVLRPLRVPGADPRAQQPRRVLGGQPGPCCPPPPAAVVVGVGSGSQ